MGDVDGNLGGSGGGGTEEGVVWVKKRPEHDLNFNIEQSEGNEFVITDLDASPELMQQIDQGQMKLMVRWVGCWWVGKEMIL